MTFSERVIALLDNPLISKDAVSRMRTWRAPAILTIYLGLLSAFGYASFVTTTLMAPAVMRLTSSTSNVCLSRSPLMAPAASAGAKRLTSESWMNAR